MANFFLLLGIGFTINFCLIRRYVLRWLNLSGVLHLVLHQYTMYLWCKPYPILYPGYFHIDLLNYLVNTPVSAMGSIRKFITNEQLLLLVQQLFQLHFICWKYFFNLPLFTGTDPKIPEYHGLPQKTWWFLYHEKAHSFLYFFFKWYFISKEGLQYDIFIKKTFFNRLRPDFIPQNPKNQNFRKICWKRC